MRFPRIILAALAALCAVPALAAPISTYPAASALTGTEKIIATQGAATVNITPPQIATFIGPSLPVDHGTLAQRLSTFSYTLEQFGGKCDAVYNGSYALTNTPTDNLPALNAILALSITQAGIDFAPTILLGQCQGGYWFSAWPTGDFHKKINVIGNSGVNDRGWPSGSSILFPKSLGGPIFQGSNTTGRGAQTSGLGDSRDSRWEGVNFVGIGSSSDLTAHGVQMRTPMTLEKVRFYNIAGDGIHIVGYTDGTSGQPYGEINSFHINGALVHDAGGDCLRIQGSDVNSSEIHFGAHQCGGAGVVNLSYYANKFFLDDITGYGNGGVYDAGLNYELIDPFGLGLNATPASSPNSWHAVSAAGGPSGNFPQYVAGTTYKMKLPIYDGGSGSVFTAPYIEILQVGPWVRAPSFVLGGTGAGPNQPGNSTLYAGGSGSSITAGRGFGVAGVIDSTHNFTDAWGVADPAGTNDSMVHWYELTDSVPNVSRFFQQWINGNLVTYGSGQKTIEWHSPIAFFTNTVDTISKFGRYLRQSDVKGLPNFALGSGDYNTTHRIIQLATSVPTSGDYAVGDILINSAPTAAGVSDWLGTVAGTTATTAWSGSQFWNYGVTVTNGGNTYINTQRGSGAASGGPTGTGTGIVDGSAKWDYRATPFTFVASYVYPRADPTTGIGYVTGAGGTVTQGTSRTTGVTLSKVTGAITLFSAAGSATPFTFTVTNTTVAATDTISVNVGKAATDRYLCAASPAAGSFDVTCTDQTGTTSEAPVINFNVIKGVTSLRGPANDNEAARRAA